MSTASPTLNVMIKAARSAARGLVRDFGEVENLQVSMKSAGDFVSKADLRSEKVLRDALMSARPAYGWLGEEGGAEPGKDPTRRWIVDPLDGTTNFLHGMPHWSISIALEHKGEVVVAVVYDPVKDEMYVAEKGQGAWMNDRRLRVSGRRDFSACVFGTGIPFATIGDLPGTLADLSRLLPLCAGVRRLGSAALDLAWVAAGRFDGFWERKLNRWDIAAGLLLVREAGGLVGSLTDGTPIDTGSVVAANPEIYDRFGSILTADKAPAPS
ncbi:MAG: inositol monophosphatase family protein [Pseudomonadota bacterium]